MSARNLHVLIAIAVVLLSTRGPLLASELDEKIESSARNSYLIQTYLKRDDITITSRQGVVTLTGTVSEEFDSLLAQQTVESLPGVKKVDNRLQLRGGRLAESSDALIAAKVKSALLFRRNVDASAIEVSVKDGVVTLRGNAPSQAQKERTTELAKNVEGVKEVKNAMTLSKTSKDVYEAKMRGRIDDASITAQIKMTLLFHSSTSVRNAEVETKQGVVTLRGKARDAAEKDLVSKLASDVKGVKSVKNEMTDGKAK